MLGRAFQDKPTLTIKLVDVYVKRILLYCSDFWGVYPITKSSSNPCEQLYLSMLKQILGVSKRTSNTGTFFELGLAPLVCDSRVRCLDNWLRVINGRSNPLLKISVQNAMENNMLWSESLKAFLYDLTRTDIWNDPTKFSPKSITSQQIKNLCQVKFRQNGTLEISSIHSKLRTYATFSTLTNQLP